MQPDTLGNFDTSTIWREILGQVPELIWAVVSRGSLGLARFGDDHPTSVSPFSDRK
jgi:hypothetical protein